MDKINEQCKIFGKEFFFSVSKYFYILHLQGKEDNGVHQESLQDLQEQIEAVSHDSGGENH